MRSLTLLITLLLPVLSIAAKMDMTVAWFNVNAEPGTCTAEEGTAISALMIPAVNKVMKGLSVIGGGRAWDAGDEKDRRSLLEHLSGGDALESSEGEDRELCSKCRSACAVNFFECKYVFNCCPCGYCRRLSPLDEEEGVSASVVASSLEIACEGVLEGITSLQLSVKLSDACMESLKASECKAEASLDD